MYESEAVGFTGDAFYNLVAEANTDLSVADCVAAFKAIEQKYGRPATSPKFCGKRLDLDLLTYDQLVCKTPVELPRDEITKNAFVLLPLSELAPKQISSADRLELSADVAKLQRKPKALAHRHLTGRMQLLPKLFSGANSLKPCLSNFQFNSLTF